MKATLVDAPQRARTQTMPHGGGHVSDRLRVTLVGARSLRGRGRWCGEVGV